MTTLNDYLAEITTLATERGYDVMELDARGHVVVVPTKGDPDRESVQFRGIFVLDTMRRCLRDISGDAPSIVYAP